LLTTVPVDIGYLGNGWGLTQKPKKVEAPLLEPASRWQKACCPTHLSFDFPHKLFDYTRRTNGFLALPGVAGCPTFTIRIVHLYQGGDEQGSANERNQKRSGFAEQPSGLA